MQTYDVIVVGGGGSGLAAAVSASEHGASVLLLEKQPELGGSTGIAVGSFTANRTRMQENAGVEDTLDAHAEDAGKFPPAAYEAQNNDELRRFFLDNASDTLDWLEGMGLRFLGPNPEPPNRVPRMHNVVPGAKAYIAMLQARLLQQGGEIRTGAPVVGLEQEDGRVTGVVSRDRQPAHGCSRSQRRRPGSWRLHKLSRVNRSLSWSGVQTDRGNQSELHRRWSFAGRASRCATGEYGHHLRSRSSFHRPTR